MSLGLQQSEFFKQDFAGIFGWYAREADESIAWRFHKALEQSLGRLAEQPDLGRLRRFRHPKLQGIRSLSVERPFHKLLIFYRVQDEKLQVIRLLHGARNLPKRLAERPRIEFI